MKQAELWIGVVELRPLKKGTVDYAGAYTNVVTWANDTKCFRRKAEEVAASLDMFVADFHWAEPLAERRKCWSLTEEIDELEIRAESNPNAILFGTFHTYPVDEA